MVPMREDPVKLSEYVLVMVPGGEYRIKAEGVLDLSDRAVCDDLLHDLARGRRSQRANVEKKGETKSTGPASPVAT